MTKQFSTTQSWQKRLMITTLAVLLSGTNCLFCCGQLLAALPTRIEDAAEKSCATQSNEVSGEDDCCAKQSSQSEHSNTAPCNDDCCILSAPPAELPGIAQFAPQHATAARTAFLLQIAVPTYSSALFAHDIQPFHNQDTYLHCCIFLI